MLMQNEEAKINFMKPIDIERFVWFCECVQQFLL